MKKLIVISLLSSLFLGSCFIEEQGMDPIVPENIEIVSDFENEGQLYFDIGTREMVKTSSIYAWDLAFDCRPGHFNILLNSAKGMAVFNTRQTEFTKLFEERDYNWEFDQPRGDLEKTAIGEWGDFSFNNPQSYSEVYILHLGYDSDRRPLGYKKFKVHGFAGSKYIVQMADLNNDNNFTRFIDKNRSFNFSYLSLQDTGYVVEIEPPKETWDIVITPAPDSIYNLSPYDLELSKGLALSESILSNRFRHSVALDTLNRFENITYFDIDRVSFSPQINTIGNNWKVWNENTYTYEISRSNRFIIKDNEDSYYGIEFLSFEKPSINGSIFRFRLKHL